jgi:hypothetical protein
MRTILIFLFCFLFNSESFSQVFEQSFNYNPDKDSTEFIYKYKTINSALSLPEKWKNSEIDWQNNGFRLSDTLGQNLTIALALKNEWKFNHKNKLSDSIFIETYATNNLSWTNKEKSFTVTLIKRTENYIIKKVFSKDVTVLVLFGLKKGVSVRLGTRLVESSVTEDSYIVFLESLYERLELKD